MLLRQKFQKPPVSAKKISFGQELHDKDQYRLLQLSQRKWEEGDQETQLRTNNITKSVDGIRATDLSLKYYYRW